MNSKNKKVVIIGASSGMGMEVAKLLLDEGCQLGVAARREDRLQALKQLAPDRVVTAIIDVTDEDAPHRLRSLIDEMGGMDLFFYSSGIGKQNRTLEPDIELNTFNTNAMGFARMIGEAYRYFAERGEGHIAAITSIAGTKGLGPAPSYSATKAMQNVYLQALEQQSNARGLKIRFTDIRPGFVDTALLSGDFRYPMMLKPEKVARQIVRALKSKRHIQVIDWKYSLLTACWRRLPRPLWRHLKL
jgi:short-subunit dehydrogenase